MNCLFWRLSAISLAAALAACGPDPSGCPSGLLPGDLVINEIMANPDGDDSANEWFEIYNNTGAAIDLEGVVLEASDAAGNNGDSHTMSSVVIEPGRYMVIGGILPEFAPPHVDYGLGSELGNLRNSNARLAVKCDVVEVDAVTYDSTSDGYSLSFTNTIPPSHIENDNQDNWCESTTEFSPGNFGTPGAAGDCSAGGGDGTCDDNGTRRPIEPPADGDLVITEVMPNPAAVDDAQGEYFEVHVTRAVDLNELVMGRDPADGYDTQLSGFNQCLRYEPGSYVVFGRNPLADENGGLPVFDFEFSFSLVNSNGMLYLANYDPETETETILDQVSWASSSSGVSINLDPGAFDPTGNDNPDSWCDTELASYGLGDLGTPGAENETCPIVLQPGECLDMTMGGMVRAIRTPAPGELTITEYMANPDVISDTDGEWIEIRLAAEVDLNELQIGKAGAVETVVSDPNGACLTVAAGGYAVFARQIPNGDLPAEVGDALFDFALNNSNSDIFINDNTGVALDSVAYTSTSAGSSSSLDETDGVTWCANATDPYGPGDNTGTPGLPNPPCP